MGDAHVGVAAMRLEPERMDRAITDHGDRGRGCEVAFVCHPGDATTRRAAT